MKVKSIKAFKVEDGIVVGGVNGSLRVTSAHETQPDGKPVYYQLKDSILSSKQLYRKAKNQWTDRENMGEFIAAAIARSVLGENHAPEVFLVYDEEHRRVLIASKYLEGEDVQTLDEYALKYVPELDMHLHSAHKKHVTLTRRKSDVSRGQVGLSETSDFRILSDSLALSIGISMMLADHDVNPSNMMVVKETQHQVHIGRIDFGHAFNHLITAPKFFGGTRLYQNGLLDFLNRDLVSGIKPQAINQLGEPSKLWRDYPGIVPSHELSRALHSLSHTDNIILIKKGLDIAKLAYLELIQHMYALDDKEGVKHIITSLLVIQRTLDPSLKTRYTIASYKDADVIIQGVFDTIKDFCFEQHRQLRFIAQLMSLQAQIDDMLLFESDSTFDPIKASAKFRARFNLPDEQIVWIKTSSNMPAFKGTVNEYIAHRKEQLIKEEKTSNDVSAETTLKDDMMPAMSAGL